MQVWMLSVVGVGALSSACQGAAHKDDSEGTADVAKSIVITDPANAEVANVALLEPCRAKIDGVTLIVGTSPLVAQLGITNWTGETSTNGTTLKREGKTVARVFGASDKELALFDPEGVPLVRATRGTDGAVSISDKQGSVIRTVTTKSPGHLTISGAGSPTLDVRGTDDALLAAIVAAPEAIPEVRALVACDRLFPKIDDPGRK